MYRNNTIFWLLIIFLFIFPTSIGRFFIDIAGSIIVVFLISTLVISGLAWFSWKKLKSNMRNCKNCGSTYFSNSESCPICGSKETVNGDQYSKANIPASSATIDISAEETE
ncbi:hypothetical protein [Prochlorococcus sp. MIT 0603]|uniref:hypothetical protein n=2 Tax=unclassified Prochlorococcus TaxID=2627481 RepID=UPI0005624F52